MPQSEKMPTLVDWYLTDQAGNPIEHGAFFRMIEKLGQMTRPEHHFGLVGKRFFQGDMLEDAPAVYMRLLSIECTGNGTFRVVTERYREYKIHRDNMLSPDKMNKLK